MVSVCLAAHNGEKYLSEQLDSILSQLGPDDELIISDDGSTDGTISIIEGYIEKDARVKLVTLVQKPQKGALKNFKYASANFENALRYARGNYIFLSDQDDVWHPDKLDIMLSNLNTNILVRSNSLLVTSDCVPIRLSYEEGSSPMHKGLLANIKAMKFSGSHMAFRREILDYALPFPKNLVSHDNWLGCIALCMGTCHYESRPLLYYRMHGQNVSKYNNNPLLLKISYRVVFAAHLLMRIIKLKFFYGKKVNCR